MLAQNSYHENLVTAAISKPSSFYSKMYSFAGNADLTENIWCMKLFQINKDFILLKIAQNIMAISGSNTHTDYLQQHL